MSSRSDRQAFMALLELVRAPSSRNARRVIDHDWSRVPRVQELGFSGMDPLDFEGVAQVAKEFLRSACRAVDTRNGVSGDRQHPLDVLEMHVLEDGATWDSILAYRREQGLSRVSERTLRNRQDEAVEYLLSWAKIPAATPNGKSTEQAETGEGAVDGPAPSSRSVPGRASHSRGRTRLWILVALALLVVVASWSSLRGRGQGDGETTAGQAKELRAVLATVPRELIGVHLEPPVPLGSPIFYPHMDDALPALELPALDSPLQSAMLIPFPGKDYPILVLGTARGGQSPGHLLLWDPLADEVFWEISYQPDPDKVLTHATLQPETREESYAARFLAYGGPGKNLGTCFAAVYLQRMSPTFVIFVDITTGAITGEYAHPGHLYSRSVYDLDADGRQELVLGGCDNSVNRAVLVALDPSMGYGAASTVIWNEEHREAAKFRVMFPRFPEWEQYSKQPRMDVYEFAKDAWYPSKEILVVSVGYIGLPELRAYHAYLRQGCEVTPGSTIVLGDQEAAGWDELGLDIEATKQRLEEGIEVIRRNER